jgi:hypothetical protein
MQGWHCFIILQPNMQGWHGLMILQPCMHSVTAMQLHACHGAAPQAAEDVLLG